jgi:long-subunit acyl-CoA synthetase (AMP-forming)
MTRLAEEHVGVGRGEPWDSSDTLCGAFQRTVALRADRPSLRAARTARPISWRQYGRQVRDAAGALGAIGVKPGDTVGLMLVNRPEFHVLDTAALHIGATPFSIYNTSPPQQVAQRLQNARCKIVITEHALAPAVIEAGGARVFAIDDAPSGAERWTEALAGADRGFDFEAAWRAVEPDHLATLIYTSGTTGPPKGVQLTHRAALAMAQGFLAWIDVNSADERLISYLPMAHVGERMITHWGHIACGFEVVCLPDPRRVLEIAPKVRPTALFAPPRVWQKLRAAAGVERELLAGRFGLDTVRCAVTSGAPIAPDLLEFVNDLGIRLVEGYGSSELGGVVACNRPEANRIGTAGQLLPGYEARLACDGELEIRGPSVMVGYRGRPDATAEVLDPDGWLRTGDIAELEGDDYVRIIDRKKEIIINAAGKNMSPANIEAELRSASSLIAYAVCIGDGRPFNVALIVVDPEAVDATVDVSTEVRRAIARANARLSRAEQIKRYEILTGEWLPDSDVLTPTMKLKRPAIETKYAAQIEALYV